MFVRKIFLLLVLMAGNSLANSQLTVVTTTEDLAALTEEVGGDLVQVKAICKGYQDPHSIDAKPSILLMLKKADLFVQIGLELEVGWAPTLLSNARNPKILPGNLGFLDASFGCDILQIPQGQMDRSQGDIHPFGNPHYWLDPANGRVIAQTLTDKLCALDPQNSSSYRNNLASFHRKMDARIKDWETLAGPFLGKKIVTYHNSWPNFAKRFGIEVAGFIEPKPGIPPSPAHIQKLITTIRAENIRILVVEPYFDLRLPEKIARESSARLVVLAPSVGAEKSIKSYFDLFDYNLKLLANAFTVR